MVCIRGVLRVAWFHLLGDELQEPIAVQIQKDILVRGCCLIEIILMNGQKSTPKLKKVSFTGVEAAKIHTAFYRISLPLDNP